MYLLQCLCSDSTFSQMRVMLYWIQKKDWVQCIKRSQMCNINWQTFSFSNDFKLSLKCLDLATLGFGKTFFAEKHADKAQGVCNGKYTHTCTYTHTHYSAASLKRRDSSEQTQRNDSWSWWALIQPDRLLSAPSRINNTHTRVHRSTHFPRGCWDTRLCSY